MKQALIFDNFSNHKNSLFYKMHPTIKLICIIFLLIMSFVSSITLIKFILITISIVLWKIAKISYHRYLSILKSCLLMFLIMFLINWISYKMPSACCNINEKKMLIGGQWDDLIKWGWIKKTNDGTLWSSGIIWGGQIANITNVKPQNGINFLKLDNFYLPYYSSWYALSSQNLIITSSVIIKIYLIITFVSLLTITSTPIQLTNAIEQFLKPLKYLKLPVNQCAMIITIAIRFVPNLIEDANRIMKAQSTRGVNFNGNIFSKTIAMSTLVIPMFLLAFKKADELADAMEARGYNPKKERSKYHIYKVKYFDIFLLIFLFLVLIIVLYFKIKKIVIAQTFLVDCYLI